LRGGAVAEWSKAKLWREKINENVKTHPGLKGVQGFRSMYVAGSKKYRIVSGRSQLSPDHKGSLNNDSRHYSVASVA